VSIEPLSRMTRVMIGIDFVSKGEGFILNMFDFTAEIMFMPLKSP